MALAPLAYYLNGLRVRAGSAATVKEARRLLLRNQPSAARESLTPLLRYEPDHPEALLILGQSFRREGDLVSSADVLGRVDSQATQHLTASLARAEVLLLDGRLEDAEVVLKSHLQRYPKSQPAHDELRWLLFNQFRTRELDQFLEAGLAEDPGSYTLLYHLLLTEMRQPVPREGVAYLLQIDERQPEQRTVDRAIGYCQWQLGEIENARKRIDKAWSADPSDWETRILAAEFLIEQNQLDTAEVCLNRDSTNDAIDDRWWWLQGRLADRRHDPSAAVEHVRRAAQLRPFELKYAHRLAQLLRAAGHADESETWARNAAAIEAANKRLTEIVLSGGLERPTLELSLELAQLHERRGRIAQSRSWRLLAKQLQSGSPG